MYTFTPSTPVDDPSWALAGVADAQGKLEEYRDMGGVVEMVSEDGETSILLTQSTTDDSESIFNLEDLTEEEQAEFLDGLAQTKTDEIQLERAMWRSTGASSTAFGSRASIRRWDITSCCTAPSSTGTP